MTDHVCFECEVLSRFLDGTLPEAETAQVLGALETCDDCGRHLEELESQSDSLVKALRADDPDADVLDEPELKAAVDQLKVLELKEASGSQMLLTAKNQHGQE